MKERDCLRLFLIEQQDQVKDKETHRAVQSALIGLKNLDHGQVDKIFKPISWGWHGTKKVDRKRLIAHAIGIFIELRRLKLTVFDAQAEVADAYGKKSGEVVKKWCEEYMETDIPVMREIIDVYRAVAKPVKGGPKASKDDVLARLKAKGIEYQINVGKKMKAAE